MMESRETYREDRDGNTLYLYQMADGLNLPVVPRILEKVDELKDFIPRDDDVFLFGFAKSGSHWTWEIVNMLLQGTTEYMVYDKKQYMIESANEEIETRPSPRVINSHLPFRYIPQGVLRGGNKIIHVIRNPKDVAASFYNHTYNHKAWRYDGKWPAFLEMFTKGEVGWLYEGEGWFGYEKEWARATEKYPDVPILYVYYEELQKDPLSTLKAISEFLGVEYSQGFYEEVIDRCSFNSMKAARKPIQGENQKWRNNEVKVFLTGKIGTWKKWFTVQQNEEFDNLYKEKMGDLPLRITFS